MMFQLSASAASMNRLIRNWTRNADKRPGAAASTSTMSPQTRSPVQRALMVLHPLTDETGRPEDEDQHEQTEAHRVGIRRAEIRRRERLRHAEHQSADDRAHHGTEAAQHRDHERLQ